MGGETDFPTASLIVFCAADRDLSDWRPAITQLTAKGTYSSLVWQSRMDHSITEAGVDLRAHIDQRCIDSGPYDEIILIGVGISGIVVRVAYLLSLGLYPDVPRTVQWAHRVNRIVLIGTPNRGISLEALPALMRPMIPLYLFLHRSGMRQAVDAMTGSDVLTDLKLRWIHHFHTSTSGLPLVCNVLPTHNSRFHRRAWMIDRVQFPRGVYLDVPGTTVSDVLTAEKWTGNRERLTLLKAAVFEHAVTAVEPQVTDVKRVVFVLHGIRASNTGWVSQISGLLKEADPHTVVVVATYGYDSLLRFPFGLMRRRHVRWFQDLYSNNFAKYPEAKFYFIGHSLGTYILGRSMARVPAMRFERIVLIGSVLPREYSWRERMDLGQATEIRNDRSSWDIPVKLFCSALHAFGKDVGTAGVDGFDEGLCLETFYYSGDHSRPLEPTNLMLLVDYVINGTYVRPVDLVSDLSKSLGFLSRLAPAIAVVAGLALIGIFPAIWWLYVTYGTVCALGAVLLLILIGILLDTV